MELLPHQVETAKFLSDEPGVAGCFSGMGSGKTLSALEAVLRTETVHGQTAHVLIIAPPIALRMWQDETVNWLHLSEHRVQILKTGKTSINEEARVLICSYQIAVNRKDELAAWMKHHTSKDFHTIMICDESHALKSVKAKRTKAILGSGGLASAATYTWLLTGTPVTRWNDDLYPFLCRADLDGVKQRCGGVSMERFQLRYTVRQKKIWPGARFPTWVTVGNKMTDELNDWVYKGGLAIRHELADVWKNMPPITHRTYDLKLDLSALDAGEKDLLAHFGKKSVTVLMGLLQGGTGNQEAETSMSTARRLIGKAKVKEFTEMLVERIESGNGPILVGAWHTEVIDALVMALHNKGHRAHPLDGRTSAARKAALQDEFNAGQIDVLVGQIAAMGVSLNLQKGGAHVICVIEEDWSPAVMEQFYARLHRMGQQNHVQVDTFRGTHKLEEAVGKVAARKRSEHARFNQQQN